MSETLIAALVGALVGGSFALLGGVVQHYLSLREDRIKRERETEQKRAEERRQLLMRASITNQGKIEKFVDASLSDTFG